MATLSMITINLHCLEEKDIDQNQVQIVNEILNRDIDVVFLQEVAQYATDSLVVDKIKKSNYGYQLQQQLIQKGYHYAYTYSPIKYSFNQYDEGLGILSKYPLSNIEAQYISTIQDYQDWHSRKYLKASIHPFGNQIDLFTVHLGWDSEQESYVDQCRRLVSNIVHPDSIIGGDFNISVESEYYQKTIEMGMIDLYAMDPSKKEDVTFEDKLDVHQESARIDYIFGTKQYKVLQQEIIFKKPMVSDHYGIYMKIEVKE